MVTKYEINRCMKIPTHVNMNCMLCCLPVSMFLFFSDFVAFVGGFCLFCCCLFCCVFFFFFLFCYFLLFFVVVLVCLLVFICLITVPFNFILF